jgi:hypothetical protein
LYFLGINGKKSKKNKNKGLPGIASSTYGSSNDTNERSRELETNLMTNNEEMKKLKNALSMIQRTRDKERIRAEKAIKLLTSKNENLKSDLGK